MNTSFKIFPLIFALVACKSHQPTEKPNIILVNIDDLGWKDLNCFGNKLVSTPNIDGLCTDGLKFTQAYSAAPVCTPTRSSIVTGYYPARLHITGQASYKKDDMSDRKLLHPDFTTQFADTITTFGTELKKAGYATACVGKWGMDGCEATDFGYDFAVDGKDTALTNRAIGFITGNCKKPFVLYLNYHYVHIPLHPDSLLLKKYEILGATVPTPAYLAVVEALDNEIGKLLRAIDQLELRQNTVFIFYSDNGGFLGGSDVDRVTTNLPLRDGKASLYEGGLRVPMIVRWPGVVKIGTTTDAMVNSYDFYATFLDIIGQKVENRDGASFLPVLKSQAVLPDRPLFWHWPHYRRGMGGIHASPSSAMRYGKWKLIYFHEDKHYELYDLDIDLGETNNLATRDTTKFNELTTMLQNWLLATHAQFGKENLEGSKYEFPRPVIKTE